MLRFARGAADGRVPAGVVDCSVVVAVAGGHLVHGQRAGLVACDARRAAQSLYCLQVLDEHVDVLHLDGGEGEGDGKLQSGVTRS